ncbi:MAG: hypothetical protein AVDCRST_MAG68-4879 [uncultured Gemmatimonadetes bacterium]|uniref:Uncharacterized protein n=1 Tax=uncultured Gemmatimonadota bacterium TaxID=203437 RepID=A0A6J4MQZ9_9BACT|nr:MAG: hypothetical protein AVDCRST_MAG68-4879 [uncultured Gemmatimonadota bacterium]
MRPILSRYARRIAPAAIAALLAVPGVVHAQARTGGQVSLSRIASMRLDTPAGGAPRYFDAPAVLPSGRIFALRMPDRRLVSLEVRGASLSATEVALPPSVQIPLALSVDAAGRLLILDPAARRVFRFTPAGSTLREAGSFAVENGVTGLCAMGGHVYVYQPASTSPVTAYSEAGVVVRRFGRQFGSGTPRRREAMSRAQLHCSSPNRRLLVASAATAEIQAYGETGQPLWTRKLAGTTEMPILDVGGGRIAMVAPPEGYHLLLSLTTLKPGWVLAQYGFRAPRQDTGFTSVQSRRIAVATGEENGRQDDLPGWLASTGGDRAVSLDQSTGAAVVWRASERRR